MIHRELAVMEAEGELESDSIANTDVSKAYSWYAAGLLMTCFTLSYVDRHILSLLVNPVKESLRLSDTQIGMVQGAAFSIFYVVATVPLARLSDSGNRPIIIGWCISVWSAMTMACGLAASFWQLMVARIGVAVGEAGLPPGSLTLLADTFDRQRLARATGVFMLAPFIGGGIALIGGGALYDLMSSWTMPSVPGFGELERWQLIFIVVGMPGFFFSLLVWITLKEPRIALTEDKDRTSIRELILFIFGEWRFSLFYMVMISMVVMLFNAHIAWMPAAIVRAHGVDEGSMGAIFGPVYMISGAVGALFAGWVVGKIKTDILGGTLRAMRLASLLLFIPALAAPIMPGFWGTIVMIGIAVFFASGINSLSSLVIQFSAPLRLRAQAIAVMGLVAALLGTGLGPLVVGILSDAFVGVYAKPLSTALMVLAAVVVPLSLFILQFVISEHDRVRLDLRQEAVG